MTEAAQSSLSSVAALRTGQAFFGFVKGANPGEYSRSYQSTSCPIPGADPEQVRKWHTELQVELKADLQVLRKYADSDGSGFVSTQEGSAFRNLTEFGYLAAHIFEEEGAAPESLALSARIPPEEVQARIQEYNALATKLNAETPHRMPLVSPDDAVKPGE